MRYCLLGGSMSYTPPKEQNYSFRSVEYWPHHSVPGHRGDELSDSGVSIIWKRILSQPLVHSEGRRTEKKYGKRSKIFGRAQQMKFRNHSRYSELRDHADSIHTWPPRSITNNSLALGVVFKTLLHPLRGLRPISCICS